MKWSQLISLLSQSFSLYNFLTRKVSNSKFSLINQPKWRSIYNEKFRSWLAKIIPKAKKPLTTIYQFVHFPLFEKKFPMKKLEKMQISIQCKTILVESGDFPSKVAQTEQYNGKTCSTLMYCLNAKSDCISTLHDFPVVRFIQSLENGEALTIVQRGKSPSM